MQGKQSKFSNQIDAYGMTLKVTYEYMYALQHSLIKGPTSKFMHTGIKMGFHQKLGKVHDA